MALGLPLLLTAALSSTAILPPRELPACSEDASPDGEEEDDGYAADEREVLTPANPGFADGERDCSEEAPASAVVVAPAVVDCNDRRASLWTREMIGSCDMPKLAPHASVRSGRARLWERDRERDRELACDGLGCASDTQQARGAPRLGDGGSPILFERMQLGVYFSSSQLRPRTARRPAVPPSRRCERPPRALAG